MGVLPAALLALTAGAAVLGGVAAESFDEPCYELGKQWLYEAKDMLLCDRTGRRVNINKICKMHLTSASGRLIIDSSKDDAPAEAKKQAGHFPELCLPGQRSYALQAPFLCTCVMHRGRHRWECVAPEGGTGRTFESVSSGRARRSLSGDPPPPQLAQQPQQPPQPPPQPQQLLQHGVSASAVSAVPLVTLEAELSEAHNESTAHLAASTMGIIHGRANLARLPTTPSSGAASGEHDDAHAGHEGNGHNGTVAGRQATPYRPNVIIDFCDEFGYVHTVSSSMRDCACDKDVIATKQFSFKDTDIYHGSSLFAAYECLPGTYNVRCEMCYADSRTCQPAPCP